MPPRKRGSRRVWRSLRVADEGSVVAPCDGGDGANIDAEDGSSSRFSSMIPSQDDSRTAVSDSAEVQNPWADMVDAPADPVEHELAAALRHAAARTYRWSEDGWGQCAACTLRDKRPRWGRGDEHFDTSGHQDAEKWVARKCNAPAQAWAAPVAVVPREASSSAVSSVSSAPESSVRSAQKPPVAAAVVLTFYPRRVTGSCPTRLAVLAGNRLWE